MTEASEEASTEEEEEEEEKADAMRPPLRTVSGPSSDQVGEAAALRIWLVWIHAMRDI